MNQHLLRRTALMIIIFISACGERNLQLELEEALCGRLLANIGAYSDLEYCMWRRSSHLGGTDFDTPAAIARSVEAGHITLDEAALETCLDKMLIIPGRWNFTSLPDCVRAFLPMRDAGESCIATAACQTGLSCVAAFGSCGGTCGPHPEATCLVDSDCPAGSSCVRGFCGNPEAGRVLAEGELCGNAIDICAEGLFCMSHLIEDGPIKYENRCRRPWKIGDACRTSMHDCGGTFSVLRCDPATQKCVRRPTKGDCLPYVADSCHPRFYCDRSTGPGTCRPLKEHGAPCEHYQECRLGHGNQRCVDGACLAEPETQCSPDAL